MSVDAEPQTVRRSWLRRLRVPIACISVAATLVSPTLGGAAQANTANHPQVPSANTAHLATAARSATPGAQSTHERLAAIAADPSGGGYLIAGRGGQVLSFGNARFEGSNTANSSPVVAITETPDGNGYWLARRDGAVEAFGDAAAAGGVTKPSGGVTGMARTRSGLGYWLATASGDVYARGDAGHHGSLEHHRLGSPVTAIAANPKGGGYWLVTANGEVHGFGTARNHGSLNSRHRDEKVVGIVSTPSGHGYWLLTNEGRSVARGDARTLDARAPSHLATAAVDETRTPNGRGLWLLEAHGTVLSYGDARNHGSARTITPPHKKPPTKKPSPPAGKTPEVAKGTGVYGFFPTTGLAVQAIRDGYPIIGDAGGLGTPSAPYVSETSDHPDLNVIQAIRKTHSKVSWMSFWTVSWPAPGDSYHDAGFDGGRRAAETLRDYSKTIMPNLVVLDPEGYNEFNAARNQTEWREFIQGWADGLASVNKHLRAGFYANQSQFNEFGLKSLPWPSLVAISPIEGNRPGVRGGNILGYAAYTAGCPAGGDVRTMKGWGGRSNTLQFGDNGVDCGP